MAQDFRRLVFYTDGHWSRYAPKQIARMSLEMKRGHIYPRSVQTLALIQEATSSPVPVAMMPQRMAMRHWKDDGMNVAPGTSIAAAVEAQGKAVSRVRVMQKANATGGELNKHLNTLRDHSNARLPQPSDNMVDDLGKPIYMPRGVPRNPDRVPPMELNRIAAQQSDLRDQAMARRDGNIDAAMSQLRSRIDYVKYLRRGNR